MLNYKCVPFLAVSIVATVSFASLAGASEKLECVIGDEDNNPTPLSKRGYSFELLSNLGTNSSGDRQCLQKIVRNRAATAFNFRWSYDTHDMSELIDAGYVTGCNQNTDLCDCARVPCQVGVEYISEMIRVTRAPSTIGFGWHAEQYRSKDIDTPVLTGMNDSIPPDQSPSTSPTEPLDPFYPSFDFAGSITDDMPPLTTIISGFPTTASYDAISVKLQITSSAELQDDSYIITNEIEQIEEYETPPAFYVVSTQGATSQDTPFGFNSIAIAWDAFEPSFASHPFQGEPLIKYFLEDMHSLEVEGKNISISTNARLLLHVDGEVILSIMTPIYTPLEREQ